MSVAQVVGVIAGAVVTFFSDSPQAGFATYAAIAGVGAYMDQPDRMGPRIEDLKVQMSQYGAMVPFEWGCNRHAGTIMWPRELTAVEHRQIESSKGGPENVTFTYTLSCAVLVCEGEIAGIRRIWANKKLVYDNTLGIVGATRDPAIGGLRFYLGTEDQGLDPLIEATDGEGPAYRGYAYVVFEDYDVTELNGRPPQWEFEVIANGEDTVVPARPIAKGTRAVIDPVTGYLWAVYTVADANPYDLPVGSGVIVVDPVTEEIITYTELDESPRGIAYNSITTEIWVANERPVGLATNKWGWHFSTITNALLGPLPVTSVELDGSLVNWPGNVVYGSSQMTFWGNNGGAAGFSYAVSAASGSGGVVGESAPSWVLDVTPSVDAGCYLMQGYGNFIQMHIGGILLSPIYLYPLEGGNPKYLVTWDDRHDVFLVLHPDHRDLYAFRIDGSYSLVATLLFLSPNMTDVGARRYANAIAYDPERDSIWITTLATSGAGDLLEVDTSTFSLLEAVEGVGPLHTGGLGSTLARVPGQNKLIAWGDDVTIIPMGSAPDPNQIALSDIVSDICLRAGLIAEDIDVTELTDLVDGYIVPRQMTARAAIEPLQAAFFFDAVESDDKIKFVKRGGALAATIPEDERAAHENGQAIPDALMITRSFELELPVLCDVEYPDIDADHLVGNQHDSRITKDTRHQLNLAMPVVMTAAKAKQIARTTLYAAWQNQMMKWATTRKYAYLEPTSIVALPTASGSYRGRITNKREQPNGVIEWEARVDAIDVYTQTGDGATATGYVQQEIFAPSVTQLALLDIPLMRDQDEGAGFYVAMGGKI